MYDDQNIFAKILRGELPCNKVYEDDEVLAFNDKYPDALHHILVIPKAKYVSFHDFMIKALPMEVASFFQKVSKVAELQGLSDGGYRIVSNIGQAAFQFVPHFHVHILSGGLKGK
jgi:diadenosine tetraphosphate (Ap4A) HIT family hydrolase